MRSNLPTPKDDHLTVVHDPAVVKLLGTNLTCEITQSIRPNGKCASCFTVLGHSPVRLEVVMGNTFIGAISRHASCAPISLPYGEIPIVETTFEAEFGIAFTRNAKARLTGAASVMTLTPAVDAFILPCDLGDRPDGLLCQYVDRGFCASFDSLEQQALARPAIYAELRGSSILVSDQDRLYDLAAPPLIRSLTWAHRGLILSVTNGHNSAADRQRNMIGSVYTWVPLIDWKLEDGSTG